MSEEKHEEKQEEVPEEEKKKKKKAKDQEPLPFCTKAPDPEHSRGSDEDEPCDDYRKGP